ncbi:MAG: hypothetical protein U0105_08540 [Candidatus Obscuribacterales bacterium]
MQPQAHEAIRKLPFPDLVRPVLCLAIIFLCGQLALVSPYGRTDSGTAGQIVVLGFLPWLYLACTALRLFKWASNEQIDVRTNSWIWLHLLAVGATLVGEMLLSWALIDSRYMLGAPFGKMTELHTVPTLALCFGAPFLLGLPACFSFAFTMARLAGTPRAGFMPGLLLSVGLLHPFTLLGATTSGIVLFGGPAALAAVSSECVWIFAATIGLLLGTLALESLRVRLARLF